MIIHGARPSPFVRKVIVFAAEKGIAAEVEAAGFGRGADGYQKGSPFGKIPALVVDGQTLYDSRMIVEFLDALLRCLVLRRWILLIPSNLCVI